VVQRLMPRKFIEGSNGWTYTTGHPCPFCKTERSFSVNFALGMYRCYAEKTDRCSGRLGQLVRRILRCKMADAKRIIQATISEAEQTAA